ncbi:MAG: FAD-dependent oxidoreductase [Oscillospiraceae bacterium]|nr:FAD-dependent oxidoreductase [Oscillospiraceae bacterium]
MSNLNPKWGAWATAPKPVPETDISERIETDVLVIGAGIAGMACALRASQMGANVVVLEKGASWSGRGGNIGVANSSYMKERGFENNLEDVAREWIKRCGNRCDERILWQYLKNGGKAMDWLIDIVTRPEYGARPALQGCIYKGEIYREIIGSHRFFDGPMAKKGMRPGGADAVYAMFCEAEKLGAKFIFKTPAEQLKKENDRVTGAYALKEDGSYLLVEARRGVVIATGDIGGNHEMCEDLSPIANRCAVNAYTPKHGNEGDGHRMGLWAGGAFEDTPFPTIMHPQAYHFSNYCFLFIDPDGKRFMNEDNYVQGKSVAILRERSTFAWSIIDSEWREKVPPTLEYGGGIFWGQDCEVGESNFNVEWEQQGLARGLERGLVVCADTPKELAEKMGVPADAFVAEFERYNDLAAAGKDDDFGKRRELMVPLDVPPYYGMKFGPALLAVAGGLRVDTEMRVLDENGLPVSGMYAIGNAAGGRYGVDYPILIAGNSHGTALTFGYLLGESLGQ